MNQRDYILYPLLAAVMIPLLGGCFGTTPSSRFYTLTPQEGRAISAVEGVEVMAKVGPVTIPSYLDRSQIVTRSGRNELELAEFDRWGGALDDEINRLLVNDLTGRLAPIGVAVAPWRSVSLVDLPITYSVSITIERFDGAPGGTVVLNASWRVVLKKEKEERPLLMRKSAITEEVGGNGYDPLVAAMGKAVSRLGKEISDALAILITQKKG
jgi:uncharacterized lipoprotein YmbA